MLFDTVGDGRSDERTRTYSQYIEFLAGLMYAPFREERSSALTYLFFQRLRNNPPADIREASMVHRCSWLYRSWSREHVAASTDGQVSALITDEAMQLKTHCSNYRNKSLYGFRMTTLLAWLLGDSYKSVHPFCYQLLSHTHLSYEQMLVFLPSRVTIAVQGLFHFPAFG